MGVRPGRGYRSDVGQRPGAAGVVDGGLPTHRVLSRDAIPPAGPSAHDAGAVDQRTHCGACGVRGHWSPVSGERRRLHVGPPPGGKRRPAVLRLHRNRRRATGSGAVVAGRKPHPGGTANRESGAQLQARSARSRHSRWSRHAGVRRSEHPAVHVHILRRVVDGP